MCLQRNSLLYLIFGVVFRFCYVRSQKGYHNIQGVVESQLGFLMIRLAETLVEDFRHAI